MATIRNHDAIIDAKAVFNALAEHWREENPSPQQARTIALSVIKPAFQQARAEIEHRFRASNNVTPLLREHTYLIDQILALLFQLGGAHVLPESNAKKAMAVIAVGGYGRGELFPYSDIDLLFLHAGRTHEEVAPLTEFMLYVLWDLGLTVGQSVRSIEECIDKAKEDMTIRTAMLDARLICGQKSLFGSLQKRFRAEVMEGTIIPFVEAKLNERDKRHLRCGDSRYVLEPNMKEGKGGLRDLHTLYWILKYSYPIESLQDLVKLGVLTKDELRAFTKSQEFLSLVRAHLHYISGRAEERLTFDAQRAIAAAMGFGEDIGPRSPERFMKRYFLTAKIVGSLTRTICAALEEEKKRKPRLGFGALLHRQDVIGNFVVDGERLTAADLEAFAADPLAWLELFATSQEHEIDMHPQALRVITQNLTRIDRRVQHDPAANATFLKILTSNKNPEITLRRMNEAGVLGRFIPDFGRVIGQMQFDRYHVFTVDEHTIFAIGVLHAIAQGNFSEESPVVTEIIHRLESIRVLYLALFCHDIAKGRGGDHSELGEKVAHKMAARLGFTPKEQETTAWLVRHHLLFSHTAFKRDINDPTTIRNFVDIVQSPERLRLLLVLTVADIRAVGPTTWNGWKGALLRDLYTRAEAMMGAGKLPDEAEQSARLRAELAPLLPNLPEDYIDEYLQLGYGAFWSGCTLEEHARIARVLREMKNFNLPFGIDTRMDVFRSVTEIVLATPDQHGLFSKVAGAMALAGANIVTAKIFTLKNGMAVEVFGVQDGQHNAFDRPEKLARLSVFIEHAIFGQLDFEKEFAKLKRSYASRMDVIKVPSGVFIENKLSSSHTVIEVNGRDRIGFLHAVTRELAALGLNISTALISTYGDRVVDVFYVKDVFGLKISHDNKLQQIRDALLKAITPQPDKKVA